MTRRPLLLLLLLPALALAASACGADEPAPARATGERVAVAITDFRYTPQNLRAKAGRLRFTLTNRGRLAHTFRVERRNSIVAMVSSLLPGDRATKEVRVRPGTYRFFCALSNHEELGMYGTLVVE
jgi:plastocyanin